MYKLYIFLPLSRVKTSMRNLASHSSTFVQITSDVSNTACPLLLPIDFKTTHFTPVCIYHIINTL